MSADRLRPSGNVRKLRRDGKPVIRKLHGFGRPAPRSRVSPQCAAPTERRYKAGCVRQVRRSGADRRGSASWDHIWITLSAAGPRGANAARLWRELAAVGFSGRPGTVRSWARRQRKQYSGHRAGSSGQAHTPSTRQLARMLMATDTDTLPETDRTFLSRLLAQVSGIADCIAVTRRLSELLRRNSEESLGAVLTDATGTAVKDFAKSLRRDIRCRAGRARSALDHEPGRRPDQQAQNAGAHDVWPRWVRSPARSRLGGRLSRQGARVRENQFHSGIQRSLLVSGRSVGQARGTCARSARVNIEILGQTERRGCRPSDGRCS